MSHTHTHTTHTHTHTHTYTHTHTHTTCQSSLTGMSPFLGDDDMETIQNISSGEYEYPEPEENYEDISDLAKEFIDSLLVRTPK